MGVVREMPKERVPQQLVKLVRKERENLAARWLDLVRYERELRNLLRRGAVVEAGEWDAVLERREGRDVVKIVKRKRAHGEVQ